MSKVHEISIVPDEPSPFAIMATQNESIDSMGFLLQKLTIRIPLYDPNDLKLASARLLEDGSGMVYTMAASTALLSHSKNIRIINKQITTDDNMKSECQGTRSSHQAFCNYLIEGNMPKTVDVVFRFPPGSTYRNYSFNDNVPKSDSLTLEPKAFGVLSKTEQKEGVEHVTLCTGVAFEMVLDTGKRMKDTKVATKDRTTELLNTLVFADEIEDEG